MGLALLPDLKRILISTKELRYYLNDLMMSKNSLGTIFLTNLPNRRFVEDRFELLKKELSSSLKLFVAFLDLDGFKEVNDSYGHETGDSLLVELSGRLRQEIKAPEVVARFGGDEIMYQVKENDKNHVSFYSSEGIFTSEDQYVKEISDAIHNNELLLHYQPKFCLVKGEIIGFEALVRGQSPEKGLVPPLDFIPMIEENFLIITLGEWVVTEVSKQLVKWNCEGFDWTVSVNIAARHFLDDSFLPFIKRTLNENPDLNPKTLEIEILESTALKDIYKAKNVIS